MIKVGDKYILHSENGLDYNIEVVNVNHFRPEDEVYGCDVFCGGVYAGDIMFFGEDFFAKCEKQ